MGFFFVSFTCFPIIFLFTYQRLTLIVEILRHLSATVSHPFKAFEHPYRSGTGTGILRRTGKIHPGYLYEPRIPMPRKATPLTDAECKKAAPGDKDYKLGDGLGLLLFVSSKGAKVWRGSYKLDGKDQTVTYGPYPTLTLKDARAMNVEHRRKLLKGEPVKPVKIAPKAKQPTLSATIAKYIKAKDGDLSAKYLHDMGQAMATLIEPDLGALELDGVTRQQLLITLMKINDNGRTSYVRKVRMWVDVVYRWALHMEICNTNPAALIEPKIAFSKNNVAHFPALSLLEIPQFLRRLNQLPEYMSMLACKLLALTWVRTDELRHMEWSEIEGDVWRIPGVKMKEGLEHIVPLPRQAIEILHKLSAMNTTSGFVFPGAFKRNQPMCGNNILDVIYGIGYKGRMSGHGWRRVASTWANSQFFPDGRRLFDKEHIEVALAHVEGVSVRAAYNSADYLQSRRIILQAYADWLDEVTAVEDAPEPVVGARRLAPLTASPASTSPAPGAEQLLLAAQ